VETIDHLLNSCLYAKVVWDRTDLVIGCKGGWNVQSIGECLKNWMQNKELKVYSTLPLVASWGIFLVHNSSIFQDKEASFQCASQIRIIFSSIKVPVKGVKQRILEHHLIERREACGYFDGASQGKSEVSGVGVVLFLSETHYFHFKGELR
jgi:hypothetical protein